MFIGGDRDVCTIWGQQALARADEVFTDLRGSVILQNCGHWLMHEQPHAVDKELLSCRAFESHRPTAWSRSVAAALRACVQGVGSSREVDNAAAPS
jgi:hypothetical protein